MQRRSINQDEKIEDESFINAFKNDSENSTGSRGYEKEQEIISTLTLKIDRKLHALWKNYANEHYMSLTQLIKNSLDFIRVEEQRGNIKVSKEKIEKL